MARPRSAVYAVEGQSRRPGIHLDWVTGQRHRHHLHETVLQRALRHAAVWQRGFPKRASPPTLCHSFATHPLEDGHGAAGAPRRQHITTYTHVRNRRPGTVRSAADRIFGP